MNSSIMIVITPSESIKNYTPRTPQNSNPPLLTPVVTPDPSPTKFPSHSVKNYFSLKM